MSTAKHFFLRSKSRRMSTKTGIMNNISRRCLNTYGLLDTNAERSVHIMALVYPSTPEGIASLASRFWPKVDKSGDCWIWNGTLGTRGYGQIGIGGKSPAKAHRVSYLLCYGTLPENLEVCHKCDNPSCVNPDHLFLGTHTDNMQDMMRKGRRKSAKGESVNTCKLTEQDVVEIRRRFISGETTGEIARDYPVERYHIRDIVCRKVWKHIPMLAGEKIPEEPSGIQDFTKENMRQAQELWDRGKSIQEIAVDMNYSSQRVGQWLKELGIKQDGRSSVNARKTHCIHGHEFTHENTYLRKIGDRVGRMCKACRRMRKADVGEKGL